MPIIAVDVKAENEQYQISQEGEIVEEAAKVEYIYKATRILGGTWETNILSRPEGIDVSISHEGSKRLVQIDALPAWDLMHSWKVATEIWMCFLDGASGC